LAEFVTYCENQLVISKKVKFIMLKNQPEVYATEKSKKLLRVLSRLGYSRLSAEETSAVIQYVVEHSSRGCTNQRRKDCESAVKVD
jgi:hypothetical protein